MKYSKTILAVLSCLALIVALALPTAAANVTYNGNAREIIFAPLGERSPANLFTNFEDVLSGDYQAQNIAVRNDVDNNVKDKIYMRSLGSREDVMSQELLSKRSLRVEKSAPTAHETGEPTTLWPWFVFILIALAVMILVYKKQTKEDD